MARMKEWLYEHLWKTLPEHTIWMLLCGVVLLLSGATPEEWVKRAVDQLPRAIVQTTSMDALALIVRVSLLVLGLMLICLALVLWRRNRRSVITSIIPATQGVGENTGTPGTPVPSELPLPPNAEFRYDGKVFWGVPRRYTKDEAEDMRRLLREVYDSVNAKSAPLVANYDGPAVMFTRNWVSIIKEQGLQSAIADLDGIRSQVRAAHTELQALLDRKPYYRQDIAAIINDHGDAGIMNGALNDYIEALKCLPDKPTVDLLKLAVGPIEDKFTKAIDGYTKWIAAFNTKMLLVKEELEFLME